MFSRQWKWVCQFYSQFLEVWKALNITVKVTAAESPFSNGLVERHNMLIANMLDKILEDQQPDLDIALP